MRKRVRGKDDYVHAALKQLGMDMKKHKMTPEGGNLFLSLVSMLPGEKNGKLPLVPDPRYAEIRSDLNRCMSALNIT